MSEVGFKEVTKKEYLASFMDKDAILSLEGNWPYTAVWSLRGSRTVLAKAVPCPAEGEHYFDREDQNKYYIKG